MLIRNPWWRSLRFVLVAAMAALWTTLFALSGWLAFRMVRTELARAIGGQCASAARLLAAQVETALPRTALIGPGRSPDPALARILDQARRAGLAEDLVILSNRGLVLADSTGEEVPGFQALGLSAADWSRLRAGETVVHAPAGAEFSTLNQSVYTPLKGGSVLELRIDPAYLDVLRQLGTAFLGAGSVGLALTCLLGVALAAWILRPLAWLESAARGENPAGIPDGDHELAQAARALAGTLRTLVRENLEARLRREEAERRGEQLRQVASAIAHEVRNPLAVIRGQSDLLGRSLGGQSAASGPLSHIRDQVARLDQVVARFLELGRVPRLERQATDLAAMLHRLADTLRQTAGSDAWSVSVDAPDARRADVDRALLEGALLNLGLNALQAMPQGGRVELALRMGPQRLMLEVRDHGPGFAAGARERLFEVFFTTKASGSGLGLPLARRAAQAHGGDLEAMDGPGGGALFRLWIPFEADKT